MVNIKVAVRIRPLSERELLHGEKIIVRKENKSVLVTNPKIPERQDGDSRQRTRRFTVDFCYDSSDPEGGTQEAVYREIGSEVLRSMHEGYNACVLAYGHSASGKTYTIMGTQEEPGLTPRLCEGLFHKPKRKCPEGRIRARVAVSFLEIYNERVRDLLGSEETGAPGGNFSLRVREHPKSGPYVQGLSEHSVADKRNLLQLLTTGNGRRSTAATENNIHSSRSHALFIIQFKQSDGENYETEKSSKIHLVDLAGSLQQVSQLVTNERASSSQSKARLQEGANINKSLATLGNVISALAESYDSGIPSKEHSNSKNWQPFVPYRDSVLTWLLKDTLGGNSNTIMIATVSPAGSRLSETVNTLRYAKRTKKIVNRPIVNEDPKIRTIRELRKEIARLRGLILFRSCGKEVDSGENETDPEEATGRSRPESKCPEPEGTRITVEEDDCDRKKRLGKRSTDSREEINGYKPERERGEKRESDGLESSSSNERRAGAAPPGGDACEIGYEKKSDVNGSVNDNFSHETQFFSDSLESFSSVFLKSGNSCDADDDASGKPDPVEDELRTRETESRIPDSGLTGEIGSCENLSKKDFPEMLRRSRPDLIKGISTRSKESLPLGSGHSCTDVSNLSRSTSDNSLNSSGSADAQPSENKSPPHPGARDRRSPELGAGKKEKGTGKDGAGNGASEAASRKKEKRSEIVNAVTSRLYVTKKKPDHKAEVPKKEDFDDDCGELEELKLCKRARMKLFDLSRKLAMTRKVKKTVDCDTQTDLFPGTPRVQGKCVTTVRSENPGLEVAASEENSKGDKKPYVIMNQVFIPGASNYVVECSGKVIRVEGSEASDRHESATQTSREEKSYKNANTSPIKIGPHEEDCFSEDSLDSDFKSRSRRQMLPEEGKEAGDEPAQEARVRFNWPPDFEIYISRDAEKRFEEGSRAPNLTKSQKPSDEASFNGFPLSIFRKEQIDSYKEVTGAFRADASGSALESRKAENPSNENSFTSAEGSENNSLSETSSEDFVFYENPRDEVQTTGDRELYTITENSEQSDPSDAFSPVQSQEDSSLKAAREAGKWDDSSPGAFRSPSGIRAKEDPKMFDPRDGPEGSRKTTSSCKSGGEKVQSNRAWVKSEVEIKVFPEYSDPNKRGPDDPKVEKPGSGPARDTVSTNVDRVPGVKMACRFVGNSSEGKGIRRRSGVPEIRDDHADPTDPRSNSQKQYLNLNISSSGGVSPFSVDTHLFGKASMRDQSTEAMSASADSITLVFMGPAKPKTSVLMEIIGRSLGRGSFSNGVSSGPRKSRSRGVQCDGHLMRSVSVDTAMIALSRIARNQDPPPEMQRTASLGKLNSDEVLSLLGKGNLRSRLESSCYCDFETGRFRGEKEKYESKYSVGTNAVSRRAKITKNEKTEAEKPKKSVSWFGEAQKEGAAKLRRSRDSSTESETFAFGPECRDVPEVETEESTGPRSSPARTEPDLPERRVRFRKADASEHEEFEPGQEGEGEESTDDLTAFLKEAIRLLKNINSRSSKRLAFSEEGFEGNNEESRKTLKKSEVKTRSRTDSRSEGDVERRTSKSAVARSERKAEENRIDLTWPRRGPTAGKPPTGTKPKFSRSVLASHPDGFPNPRTWFRSGHSRTGSNGRSRDISEALGDPHMQEIESGPPGSRSVRPPPFACPKRQTDSKQDFDSVSDMETDLEEYCRRLEVATERDKMREKIQRGQTREFARPRNEDEVSSGNEDGEDRSRTKNKKPGEVIKRRTGERCAGGCVCETSGAEPCKRLWSRGCRSSFELDSFGPGSRHCHQLCMFCRKKEAEMYYSAACLNSECSSGLCRLNYYGFCPCSPVKLSQVASSPRAYMQHLLALRKQIVRETKHPERDAEEAQRKNCQGFPLRGRSGLSNVQNFS